VRPTGPGFEPGRLMPHRFANGELEIRLGAPVSGRDCLLVGSVAPPSEQMLELLLAANTLRRQSAQTVAALLPYLAYMRQDHPSPGGSLAAAWVGALLAASGVDQVITVDLHSERARELLCLPVRSLSPADLFAAAVGPISPRETVVVAPDRGAIERSSALAGALGVDARCWLEKQRDREKVTHTKLVGELRRSAVVVDDILDTGGTLISCCRELRSRGVEEITLAVTHGLFTGQAWRQLFQLGVGAIHTTDSVPSAAAAASELVHVHPLRPLLERALVGAHA
jgi:ribose-phosphate pyrophosphokinase